MEPLTVEEFLNLDPTQAIPPGVMAKFLERRHIIEKYLPMITKIFRVAGARARDELGFNVPKRFLPDAAPVSDEEVLRIASKLYQKMLDERMA